MIVPDWQRINVNLAKLRAIACDMRPRRKADASNQTTAFTCEVRHAAGAIVDDQLALPAYG
jgi:hypothetical protein